mgnify:CR=1 FL=1
MNGGFRPRAETKADRRREHPGATIDWVVEEGYVSLVRLNPHVRKIIPWALRRWRKSLGKQETRAEIRAFFRTLREDEYDYVFDTQGLLKTGIIMGAGLSAVVTVFKEGGRFDSFPWTISIAIGIAFYLVFSIHFQELKKRNRFWWNFAKLGIFPIILLAVIVAPIFGEAPWPSIEWGISQPDFVTLWNEYTVFGLGMPPLMMFVTAIPTVFAAYLVVFGDVLGARAILSEADHIRRDEKVDFNPNRSHLIFGGRNAFMSIFGPDVAMCGPQWSAMQVVITERFKGGAKAMKSIYGGVGSFRWGTNTGLLLLPVVTLVQPILGVALALTLLIQGYVSVRLGIMEARSQRDLGIAGVIGAVLAIKGAGWAFAIGVGLCLLIYGAGFFRGENDQTFSKDLPDAEPANKD